MIKMFNKKIKMMLLLVLLTTLLIGITSATNVSNDNSNNQIQKQENKIVTKTVNTGTTSKIQTKLTLNKIKNTEYKKNMTITGKYMDTNGKKLKNTLLQIKVNNKTYKTKTNNKGTYTFTLRANTPGTNKIKISYPGNKKYQGTSIQSTFKVTSKATQIKLDKVPNTYYNSPTTIRGHFLDSDKNMLKNTVLTIKVNNKKYHTKTDKNGHFNYTYKAKNMGTNNITVSYNGNQKYTKTDTSTTFNVKTNPTHIKLNPIKATKYNENIIISGKYMDINNKALLNTHLKININGKNYTTKTDKKGLFEHRIRAKTLGKYNITVIYPGNTNYSSAKASTTINITPLKTKIIITKIPSDIKANEYLDIEGKFVDEKGNILKNTELNTENIYSSSIWTDKNGKFTSEYLPYEPGEYTIKISFPGNKTYYPSSISKTVNVGKIRTYMNLYEIGSVKLGKNYEISGYMEPYYLFEGQTLEIKLNDKFKYKTRIDEFCRFNITLKADTLGLNNISVKYFGNKDTLETNESRSFFVYDVTDSNLTLPFEKDTLYFEKSYENYYMFIDKSGGNDNARSGVIISGYDNCPAVHRIVNAKFYLKDSDGNIITMMNTSDSIDRVTITHSKKYIPYKVKLIMKELTDYERENYYFL